MSAEPVVVVVGSVHIDLVATGPRLPRPGESVTGESFVATPGGKGGNQACQLALAGCRTYLVSRVGDDTFGRRLRDALAAKGVRTDYLTVDHETTTGASPVLSAGGEYLSMIVPGAAGRLGTVDLDAARPAFADASAVVVQLELPLAIARQAAELGRKHGARVVLNASPIPNAPEQALADLLPLVDVVVVNRHEARRLGGSFGDGASPEKEAARLRAILGVAMVVVTLGEGGAVAATATECVAHPAFPSSVRDTVGAGDAFLGVFVAALIRGDSLERCLLLGTAAGALAVTRAGAYDALPRWEEVASFPLPLRDPGREDQDDLLGQ